MKLIEALRWSSLNTQMKSDGCTNSPDFGFSECCVMHDRLIRAKKVPRKDADILLRECIESHGHEYLALFYYVGVRLQATIGFPAMFGIVFLASIIGAFYFFG